MRGGTSPTGGISPTSYTSLAMLAPFAVAGSVDDRRAPADPATPGLVAQVVSRVALDGHVSERGHHVQYGPGVSAPGRPAAEAAAARIASITRSAARSRTRSSTSSACHSPESRYNVATRYGGIPNRSPSNSA